MSDLELESLLSPLDGASPCGADLEYDPAFLALQEAAAGKPERQYGDTLIPAEGPDWPAVREQALKLATRTRDLRLAVWLTRSGARLQGLAGAVEGLQLLQGLLERHWDQVHPQLDKSDGNDPTARMSALGPLVHPSAGLADLRAASLTGQRGALTMRDIELALGHAEPQLGESPPSADGIARGLAAALPQQPTLPALMNSGAAAARAIAAVLERQVAPTLSPELEPLVRLMQALAEAAQRLPGAAAPADTRGNIAVSTSRDTPVPAGTTIASREDAVRALERVAEWLERNEPSNPAPLLIRRSQRLMSKSFIDIVRDLAPDGLSQIEKLAGSSNP
ncbi:type VI secretion system protein TssA [Roseateles violae]|uniref:Type VI secretion system protein TssA n=1 Tax=Roseateles violae TaxID=3058042 RepID=A0ABT8DNU5_9BURK|nr:type VI secretion system protein TssA [Pelomonas sp. PFR6]MDN3920034.1 type VI secretion system protein TssA [Pelomonas sp. PFR6]